MQRNAYNFSCNALLRVLSRSTPILLEVGFQHNAIAADIVPLSLPPEAQYASLKLAQRAISLHVMSAGYAFSTGKNDKIKGSTRRVLQMHCKRFGEDRSRISNKYRIRHHYTVKCNCRFSIKIRERPDGSWEVRHREGLSGVNP